MIRRGGPNQPLRCYFGLHHSSAMPQSPNSLVFYDYTTHYERYCIIRVKLDLSKVARFEPKSALKMALFKPKYLA